MTNSKKINAKFNTSGAKGFGVGGGRAPPDSYFQPLLGRTLRFFQVASLLKLVWDIFG
jgi:hypothetical protein